MPSKQHMLLLPLLYQRLTSLSYEAIEKHMPGSIRTNSGNWGSLITTVTIIPSCTSKCWTNGSSTWQSVPHCTLEGCAEQSAELYASTHLDTITAVEEGARQLNDVGEQWVMSFESWCAPCCPRAPRWRSMHMDSSWPLGSVYFYQFVLDVSN